MRGWCERLTIRMALGLAACILPALLAGCAPLDYYWQAARGQADLLRRRQPIEKLVNASETSAPLKAKLALVLELRAFAEAELALPAAGQFLSFAQLDRPYVVWNLFAAPEFSTTPHTWCYPVIGCAAYRGFFSASAAQAEAEALSRQGFDVHVGGVAAYSTLGWFDDPLPSSVIHWSATDLAALVFHELAHRLLYLPDDTTFNESFATAVEQEGLRRWAEKAGHREALTAYRTKMARREALLAMVLRHRRGLETLYRSALAPEVMRRQKEALLRGLQEDYVRLQGEEPGRPGGWQGPPPNNAWLVPFGAYHDLVPGFAALLAEVRGDLPAFYARCRALQRQSREARAAYLQGLATNGRFAQAGAGWPPGAAPGDGLH